MNDPQYTLRIVLKPYLGFEAVYQGQAVTLAVNLTPFGESALDDQAGNDGYDPRLPRAIPVPLGARVNLWLPRLYSRTGGVGTRFPYIYQLLWRMRSLVDYDNERKPYHNPSPKFGVPNTFVLPAPRYAIPVATQGVLYNQAQPAVPATSYAPIGQFLFAETIHVIGTSEPNGLVINPDGQIAGFQQGIVPAAAVTPPFEMVPSWLTYDCTALGDELVLLVNRADNSGTATTWDFTAVTGADLEFSRLYGEGVQAGGLPDLGSYVMTGVAAT